MARRFASAAAACAAAFLAFVPGGSAEPPLPGPAPTSGPTILGTAAAGKRLTGLSGTWAGFGTVTYHFQWYRCNAAGAACLSIHGATSPSYAISGKDVGRTLGLTVSATDSTGTASAYSSLIGPIAPPRPLLESTVQPTITGAPVVGRTLQVGSGSWSPMPASISYRWERCNANARVCAAIPNQTQTSYTLSDADLGHTLLVILEGTNGATIQNAFSAATPAVVGPPVHGPALAFGPSLDGIAIQGQPLLASTGIWRGVGPIVFSFNWFRCDTLGSHCQTIHGARSASYKPGQRDIGDTIGVTLRATDSVGRSSASTSLVGPVAGEDIPLTPTTLPTITGVARVGGVLRTGPGLWTDSPSSFTYQWLRCNHNGRLCHAIPGATGLSYRPAARDKAHALVVQVVAKAAGNVTQAALTAATAPIVP